MPFAIYQKQRTAWFNASESEWYTRNTENGIVVGRWFDKYIYKCLTPRTYHWQLRWWCQESIQPDLCIVLMLFKLCIAVDLFARSRTQIAFLHTNHSTIFFYSCRSFTLDSRQQRPVSVSSIQQKNMHRDAQFSWNSIKSKLCGFSFDGQTRRKIHLFVCKNCFDLLTTLNVCWANCTYISVSISGNCVIQLKYCQSHKKDINRFDFEHCNCSHLSIYGRFWRRGQEADRETYKENVEHLVHIKGNKLFVCLSLLYAVKSLTSEHLPSLTTSRIVHAHIDHEIPYEKYICNYIQIDIKSPQKCWTHVNKNNSRRVEGFVPSAIDLTFHHIK